MFCPDKTQLNYAVADNGASIHSFTSQYHHESRCSNLLLRDHSLCWFTSVQEYLPQHVIIDMGQDIVLSRVGLFLHGENNQNPKHIQFHIGSTPDCSTAVVSSEIDHRGGDHLFDIEPQSARYVKYTIDQNFGGSGAYTTKLLLFGHPQ